MGETVGQNSVKERIVSKYLNEKQRVESHYRNQGWEVAIKGLKGKTIAEKMKAFAVNGGVELRAPCGCQRLVNPDGTEELIVHCDDHPDGIPELPKIEKIRKAPCCGEHGTPMEWRQDKRYHCKECEINDR